MKKGRKVSLTPPSAGSPRNASRSSTSAPTCARVGSVQATDCKPRTCAQFAAGAECAGNMALRALALQKLDCHQCDHLTCSE